MNFTYKDSTLLKILRKMTVKFTKNTPKITVKKNIFVRKMTVQERALPFSCKKADQYFGTERF